MKRDDKKKPSGAQFRKQREKVKKLAEKMLATEQASGATAANVARYKALGNPSADALANVLYGNVCIAALLQTVMNDTQLDEATRRKEARGLVQALGMTGVKAIYERRLAEVARKIYGDPNRGEAEDGLEPSLPDDDGRWHGSKS